MKNVVEGAFKFEDLSGNGYDVRNISSMSRSGHQSSVIVEENGQMVVVEVAPTEAIKIVELLD